eukprot:COSAG02_NODE_1259_length_13568_cov_747.342267_7_plen_392_part_00
MAMLARRFIAPAGGSRGMHPALRCAAATPTGRRVHWHSGRAIRVDLVRGGGASFLALPSTGTASCRLYPDRVIRVVHNGRAPAAGGAGGADGADGAAANGDDTPTPTPTTASGLVSGINRAMSEQPLSCIGYVMACRYAVFFPVVYCVRHFELMVPTELALAYVLTRPLVKLRFPIELGIAALLAWVFPALTKVKVSALLGLLPSASESAAARRKLPFHSVPDYVQASYPSRAEMDPVSSAMAMLAGPADRYGAAFYVRAATYYVLASHVVKFVVSQQRVGRLCLAVLTRFGGRHDHARADRGAALRPRCARRARRMGVWRCASRRDRGISCCWVRLAVGLLACVDLLDVYVRCVGLAGHWWLQHRHRCTYFHVATPCRSLHVVRKQSKTR